MVPLRSILGNTLKKRSLVLHHDGTPQSDISSDGVRDISDNKRGRSLLDVGTGLGIEGNHIEVGDGLVNEGREGGEKSSSLHPGGQFGRIGTR